MIKLSGWWKGIRVFEKIGMAVNKVLDGWWNGLGGLGGLGLTEMYHLSHSPFPEQTFQFPCLELVTGRQLVLDSFETNSLPSISEPQ